MTIRSKALFVYLLQSGAMQGTEEDIARAKQEYRRIYKKQWKELKRPTKEIRFAVTLRQLNAIKAKARERGIPHTTYSRTVILESIESKPTIPNLKTLLQLLQILSMAAIAAAKNATTMQKLTEQLEQAESMLLGYIHMK